MEKASTDGNKKRGFTAPFFLKLNLNYEKI